MILDTLSSAHAYESLHPRFAEAFAFLHTVADLPNGRYDLGDGMYCNLGDVTTHPAGDIALEAHVRYIDIQYLLSGSSLCHWQKTAALTQTVPYDPEKDVSWYQGKGHLIPVEGGMFYIMFPTDAHEPHCTGDAPSAYRLAVVKVPVLARE